MIVKLLTEHHLEFLSLEGGCTASSESTPVKLLEISCHGSFVLVHIGCASLRRFQYALLEISDKK